jgi:hypothetical protein
MGSDRYSITITHRITARSSLSQSRAVIFMAGETPLLYQVKHQKPEAGTAKNICHHHLRVDKTPA